MALARGRLILGINCAYHESAAALVRDGEVCFAIEEERLTRTKHAKTARVTNPDELPWNAIRACLAAVPGATLSDLDAIAYSLVPDRRLALIDGDPYEIDDNDGLRHQTRRRRIQSARAGSSATFWPAPPATNRWPRRFHFVPHHRAHAASAFYASPFRRAAVLVVDGIGETSTAWLGRGSPRRSRRNRGNSLPSLDRHALGAGRRLSRLHGIRCLQGHGTGRIRRPRRFASEFDRLFRRR